MQKIVTVFSAALLLTALSGCAGHKELRAPCSNDQISGHFSSVAYAADKDCGPLVRQAGVSVF